MATQIELNNLTKTYSGSTSPAVDDLSISIKSGEIYGFLGSNGAGKSTTIRLLMDFIKPTSGTATILGKDSLQDSVELKKDIGYLAGDVALPKKVTGRQLLNYLASLNPVVETKYAEELERRFEAQLDKRINTLSKGNRQKIGIIQAFMHKPKVLILDEPTSGLDPLMQEEFYKTVTESKQRGATVFLSSHSIAEVQKICDRIGIIREGKIVHEDTISRIMEQSRPTWNIVLKSQKDLSKLKKSAQLNIISSHGATIVVRPTDSISKALADLSSAEIVSMGTEQENLEDEFMDFYKQGNKL